MPTSNYVFSDILTSEYLEILTKSVYYEGLTGGMLSKFYQKPELEALTPEMNKALDQKLIEILGDIK
jgi:hypothetical protein